MEFVLLVNIILFSAHNYSFVQTNLPNTFSSDEMYVDICTISMSTLTLKTSIHRQWN